MSAGEGHRDALIERIQALSASLAPIPTSIAPHCPKITGLRAVLFDVYGTLMISGSGDISLAAPADLTWSTWTRTICRRKSSPI